MSTRENPRLYKVADASLKQLVDDLRDSIVRDTADFTTRGFDAAKLTAFEALIEAFNNTTTDEELRGQVTTAVELKDALATNIKQELSAIRSRVKNKYGEGTGKYNSFGFGELSLLNDDELYRTAKRVIRISTTLLEDLKSEGLTQAILDNVVTITTNFDLAIDKVGEANENRDLETQDRVEKGNKVYTEMVKLAGTGKSLYEFNNQAKYNDYVLIQTIADKEEPETPVTPPNS